MTSVSKDRVPDPLGEAARLMPEAVAVVTPERTLSYRALDRIVTAAERQLQSAGVSSGGCVGLYLPNGWRALVLVLAAIRAGRVACPMSLRLPPPGVSALLRMVSASLLITDHPDLGRHLPHHVNVTSPEAILIEEDAPGSVSQWVLNKPATIIFTSGSTGASKAALHSFGNHYYSAKGSNENMALALGDRWLLALPLFHVGGLGIVFRCLLAGATLVLAESGLGTGAAIRRHGITHVSLVATQLQRLLEESEEDAPVGLKAMLVGGSAVPTSLIREAYARGYPLYTTYGLTEMTSQVTTTPPGTACDRLATSGRSLPYRRLRIVEDGEILVQGDVLFQGYVDGEVLHRPFDEDGWFHTGDRGRLDEEGFLHVLGRVDNMFISGGENIHPEEIEQALCTLDGVHAAVVVPVTDAVFGQRPIAFVKMTGRFPMPSVFVDFLEALLPRFKIPLAFYTWPDAASHGMKVDRAFFLRYAAQTHQAEK